MSLHSPINREFFVIGGNVMTAGDSLNLAKGQIGLFDPTIQSKNGIAAVSTLAGVDRKSRKFVLKMGVSNVGVSRSTDNKAMSTQPFSISDVVGVRASAPTHTGQTVDEVILGYNGVNADTAITFTKGDRKTIFIRVEGEWVGMLGFPFNYVDVQYTMEADACEEGDCSDPDCDTCDAVDCSAIIIRAVEFLKSYDLRGGVLLGDVIDITPIKSCTTEPTFEETPMDFQTLTVTDGGDETALSLVQAQFPDYKVIRKDRTGTTSIYEVITEDSTTLDPYVQTIASILKGCEDCPDGYTAVPGGVLYAVSIEDDGADLTTTIDNLPGFVTGTVIKHGQNNGVGFYTLLVDNDLTPAEIATFIAAGNPGATSTITRVGIVEEFCSNSTETEIDWVVGDSCNVSSETYTILLPDDECGDTRLAEIQAAYPELTIAVSQEDSVNSQRIVTLTGTSGTANITVTGTGTAYLATFATSLTQTATNFVTAHAADLLADEGITVTSNAATLIFTHATTAFPTITAPVNATGDLAGTIGAVTVVEQNVAGGCMTQYETTVITNLVCDECDPIYKDYYVSEAPEPFDNVAWTLVAATPAYAGCLCGIRFKGKETVVLPDEYTRDLDFGYIFDSTRIEVSGGFVKDIREGITGTQFEEPMNVQYLSRWTPATHMGGNLWEYEDTSRVFFTGNPRHENFIARMFKGEQSHIEAGTQYVDYAIDIRRTQYSQGMSERHESTNTYHIFVELGRQAAVESLVNMIAAAAGLPGVNA